MGDPSSTMVFSIDPGIVNVGVSCYDYSSDEIIYSGKLTLAPSLKAMKSEAEIVPRVFKLFFDDANSPYKKLINASRVVLIENQMKRKMLLVQHCVASFCFAGNIEYQMVDPRTIKTHFDIGSYARKKAGAAIVGTKGNYGANKKMAIVKVKELFPGLLDKVSVAKQDDMADSLLQAVWFGDKQLGRVRPKTEAPVIAKVVKAVKKATATTTKRKRKPAVAKGKAKKKKKKK